MSIEEKKKPLEFIFTPDGVTGPVGSGDYEIVYNPDYQSSGNIMDLYPLNITNSGQSICCPVELLIEVINFLKEKGVIEEGSNLTNFVPSGPTSGGNILPLPTINDADEEISGQEDLSSVQSFTSFEDVTDIEIEDIVVPEDESAENVVSIKVGDEEVASEEIISRQVIRTRIGDSDDPQQAEKDAAIMRGEAESNFKRI